MAEGERKNVTVTEVAAEPRLFTGSKGPREAWKVQTQEIGPVEVVIEPGSPPPKVGENLLLTVYPSKGDFPPSGYPAKGGGAGGRPRNSPEERRSIERQVAVKIAAEKVGDVPEGRDSAANWSKQLRWVTDQVHAAIKGE